MIPYPNRHRAERAVRRRREQCLRTLYANVPRRIVQSMSDGFGYDFTLTAGTSAARLRPVLDHIESRRRCCYASFRRLFLNASIRGATAEDLA